MMEFGRDITGRMIDNKPPLVMEGKQFQVAMIVQQYVEIFSRKGIQSVMSTATLQQQTLQQQQQQQQPMQQQQSQQVPIQNTQAQ